MTVDLDDYLDFVDARLPCDIVVTNNITNNYGDAPANTFDFTDSDLSVAGVLVRTHTLGRVPSTILILDENQAEFFPEDFDTLSSTAIAIDFTLARPLAGTWRLIIDG